MLSLRHLNNDSANNPDSGGSSQVVGVCNSGESSPESSPSSTGKKLPEVVRIDLQDVDSEEFDEDEEERKNENSGIEVVVRAKAVYKICTVDPEGEDDDTWAVLLAVFEQKFLLSRRPAPDHEVAIVKGNETVSLQFFNE